MIKYLFLMLPFIIMVDYGKYQIDTGDKSLQGYFEHIKKKYWDKPKDDDKREP